MMNKKEYQEPARHEDKQEEENKHNFDMKEVQVRSIYSFLNPTKHFCISVLAPLWHHN